MFGNNTNWFLILFDTFHLNISKKMSFLGGCRVYDTSTYLFFYPAVYTYDTTFPQNLRPLLYLNEGDLNLPGLYVIYIYFAENYVSLGKHGLKNCWIKLWLQERAHENSSSQKVYSSFPSVSTWIFCHLVEQGRGQEAANSGPNLALPVPWLKFQFQYKQSI